MQHLHSYMYVHIIGSNPANVTTSINFNGNTVVITVSWQVGMHVQYVHMHEKLC